ncbi:MAG: hypothetical protein ACYDHW_12195 [Syntrophorhabdaceae bacterium]
MIESPDAPDRELDSIQSIKEKAREILSAYEKTKSAIRKEVKREYARELALFEKERQQREAVVKEKIVCVERLESQLESLNNRIYGLQSKSKLWEHECARISEAYRRTMMHYSNPGLVEAQLQVILEYADALIRFVGVHKWDRSTVIVAEEYCKSIYEKLLRVVHVIDANKEDDMSLVTARKTIAGHVKNNSEISPG